MSNFIDLLATVLSTKIDSSIELIKYWRLTNKWNELDSELKFRICKCILNSEIPKRRPFKSSTEKYWRYQNESVANIIVQDILTTHKNSFWKFSIEAIGTPKLIAKYF